MNYCKKCSRLTDDGIGICPYCGNNLEEQNVSANHGAPGELSQPLKELNELINANQTVDREKNVNLQNSDSLNEDHQTTDVDPDQNFSERQEPKTSYYVPVQEHQTSYSPIQDVPQQPAVKPVVPPPAFPLPTPVPPINPVNTQGDAPVSLTPYEPDTDISIGIRILLYAVAILFPVVGTIIGVVYINKPTKTEKYLGHSLVIITCIIYALYLIGCCAFYALLSTGVSVFSDIFSYFY